MKETTQFSSICTPDDRFNHITRLQRPIIQNKYIRGYCELAKSSWSIQCLLPVRDLEAALSPSPNNQNTRLSDSPSKSPWGEMALKPQEHCSILTGFGSKNICWAKRTCRIPVRPPRTASGTATCPESFCPSCFFRIVTYTAAAIKNMHKRGVHSFLILINETHNSCVCVCACMIEKRLFYWNGHVDIFFTSD